MNRRKILFVLVPIILFVMLAICVQAEIVTRFEGWAYNEAVENMSPVLTFMIIILKHIFARSRPDILRLISETTALRPCFSTGLPLSLKIEFFCKTN